MKYLNICKLSLLLVISLFLISCDEGEDKTSLIDLTPKEMADLGPSLPQAISKLEYPISQEKLNEEEEVLAGSDFYYELYDENSNLLGYYRLINSGVGCHDGQCAAIKFILVYDSNLNYVSVFHPSDEIGGRFYKGIINDTENSELFTETDWENLHSILSAPPNILLDTENRYDVVDAETGATFQKYENAVVPQAAYTTYTVLEYMIHTKEIISAQLPEDNP
ncbi:MAG: hypothetical protein ACQES9_00800 [Myxococcota bacterium]